MVRPHAPGGSWRDVLLSEVGHQLPTDRVHFLGGLPYRDYLRVLQVSACHVYLTYPFVLSWSCLEAMSAGCTLVASDTGPVREVIDDGVDGLLTDFFDVQALVQRVVSALDGRQTLAGLGTAARQKIVSRYDLQAICLPGQMQIVTNT
jgi:glycosyltransferase involved in cell wall biosynthesis